MNLYFFLDNESRLPKRYLVIKAASKKEAYQILAADNLGLSISAAKKRMTLQNTIRPQTRKGFRVLIEGGIAFF